MAVQIDTRAIAALASSSESTINTLLQKPTPDLVQAFLEAISSKVLQHIQLKAHNERVEVELEASVRTNEARVKALKASVEKGLSEITKLRSTLQESENARTKAEREVEHIQSLNSDEAAEVSILRSRVTSLEASNRDTLGLLDSKVAAYDKLAEELSGQQQKAQSYRREVSELEQKLHSANSTAASTRFREQSIAQELNLSKRSNEWLEAELTTKNADHLKFRKEKSARITELQQANENIISQADSLKRSEAALRVRLEEQIQKVEDSQIAAQELRDEASRVADSFRNELDTATRLAELQKTSADTAKKRAHELSLSLEEVKDEAADEVGRIRAEVQTEHEDKITAEKRVAELESTVAQLQSERDVAAAHPGISERINGHGTATPSRPGTPSGIYSPSAFSPSSASRGKGNLSMTQMFSEYKKLEKALAHEKRHAEQLSKSLDEMVETVETTQPEIDELRADHAKMQEEMVEISKLRDAATKERDISVREARKLEGQMEEYRRERDIFQQQVRDTSSQIKVLLMEQHLRETGKEISQEEMAELQRAAVGDEIALAAMSDTGRIISENLTVFRNIAELQEQNTKIHSMLRQLGAKMEASEAQDRESIRRQEREELESLRSKVVAYKDELQNAITQSNSFVKERDMFRSMLVRRGQLPVPSVEAGAFAQSLPLTAARGAESHPAAATSDVDYGKLLKDLQHHFDSYKKEAAADNTALKTQLNDVTQRNSQLQADLSKQVGLLSAASSRSEILQNNYDMLKSESQDLHKRSDVIRDNASKQELRTQQAAEDLVEARGQIQGLYREAANLKAEKDLWKSVESRLVQDTEDLRNERGRMENLNNTLQNILNEREQADSELTRRTQRQIDNLESELSTTKRKLDEEVEDGKRSTLRREYEHEQSQKRIDDLMTTLASDREESIRIKSDRDHLQARAEELTIELRSAEEKIQVLLPKQATEGSVDEENQEEERLAREQELSVEISELKRDLELKNNELERLNEQVETYKNISQSSEERLQELNETQDQYREETDRALEEKNRTIAELEGRVEDISSELATTNNELSRLRDEQSTIERRLSDQKTMSDQEISRLKDQVDQQTARAEVLLSDVKSQAKIAGDYQQNYEDELQKHADAAKTLSTIRGENNQLRLEMVELRTAAESVKASLDQREESWSEQKIRYEKEIDVLSKRRGEISDQNTLLHKQLEEVTKQISSLQRDRDSVAQDEGDSAANPAMENLQEIIKYLRREKEIVDVQFHLSTQEGKRVKQQLDHAQSQLDETRLKLDQQLRSNADTERNELNHNKLMETLNELNLYRESSVTLRAEAKRATNSLAEKSTRVDELVAEIEPLQTRIAELENHSELREGEMKLLQQDRDHWQTRTQNILAKYDRVDPAELETLRQNLATLETERDEAITAKNEAAVARDEAVAARDQAVTSQEELQSQVDTIPSQIETAKVDLRARLSEQFKARNKEMTGRVNQKQIELDAANSEKTELQTELTTLREQLNSLPDQSTTPQTNGVQETPITKPTSQPESTSLSSQEVESKIANLESELTQKDEEIARLQTEKDSAVKAREDEMRQILNKRLAEVKAELTTSANATVAEVEEKLTAMQKESDALRSENAALKAQSTESKQASMSDGVPQPDDASTSDQLPALTEAQIKILIRDNETVRNILRNNIRKAVDKEKEAVRKEFEALQGETGTAPSSGLSEEVEKKFAAQKEALIKELEDKFESEKQELLKSEKEKHDLETHAILEEQENKIASAKQNAIIQQQENFAEQKLALSRDAEKKAADQIALAEKRTAAKMNMATNQSKNASFKLAIVSKAAEETPQKPVVEVWVIAKDARPPPASAVPKPSTSGAPAAAALPAVANATPEPEKETKTEAIDSSPAIPPIDTGSAPATDSNTRRQSSQPLSAGGQAQQTGNIPKPSANPGQAAARGLSSLLPRGGRSDRGRGDRGRGAGRGQAQSQEAGEVSQQPGQPGGRGSGIPRGSGRGQGQGRGGAQGKKQGEAGGAGSLNPEAGQFTPANNNKRGREDAVNEDSRGGKRIRGIGRGQ